MKKLTKLLSVLVLTLSVVALVACGSVSQKYADKVNDAAKSKKYLTYAEVEKALGDPTVNASGSGFGVGVTGACTWYKGCKTYDDAKAKVDAGKKVPYITITFADGAAMSSSYSVLESSEE